MTVQNMWPLIFLIMIPVIILLYLLKQKVRDERFSSTLLWKEIYKNLEARTPFEKWKQNILMYLQILLMLLLIFALMAPVLKKGGTDEENTIFVIDNSASMQYLYDEGQTRLERSIEEAKKEIDALSEDASVTLISCSSEAAVMYQGKDKGTLKKRLNEIEPTMEAGTLDRAAGIVNSVISGMERVQILCYTDTDFSSGEWTKNQEKVSLIVEDMYSKGNNCSLDYVNYSVSSEGVETLCKITNFGEDSVTQDVSLYINGSIADVQTVSIAPQESETVYFAPQDMATDGSTVITAELSEKDSLNADNSQSAVVVGSQNKKVLLLSEGNVFLEKALSLDENVEVYKSEDSNVLNQVEDSYDLYVFDGIPIPDTMELSKLPETAGFLFFNYKNDMDNSGYIMADSEVENALLYFQESPVTNYVEAYSFGITKAYTYTLPEWAVPVIRTEEGGIIGYYGRTEHHTVGVIGFDIHSTDLALQTEFPIFMSQLSEAMLGTNIDTIEFNNFPVTEESDVTPVDSVVIKGSQENRKTGGRAIRNFVLLLVLLLFVMEWIIYTKQVHSTKKKQFLAVRCLLVLVIILAMAGVSVSKKQKKSETIFLVDVSDSMSGNIEELEEYLRKQISGMPEKNLCGIVAFGKDTAIDQFLSDKKMFSELTVHPVTTATNIEKAIQASTSLFDDGVSKRLVLITDGSENEGSMSLSASTLKGNDVELYTISMEDSISGNSEVYIDGLTVPNVIHAGDYYNVAVSVTSNVETDATLSLYAGRNLKGQQEIHLNKGKNQFVFEDTGIEGTIARYRAVIEPKKDTISVNNTYVAFAEIDTKPRVLLIEGGAEEGNEFEKILAAANIDYDKVTPTGVPASLSELNQYKAVITLDVYYDDLRSGFIQSLETYIKDFAGGYICIGGENSYALGNYKDTVLEEVLPVNMDLQGEKEIPKMAMTMVIDQSGSMSSPSEDGTSFTGLDLAKQAAISGVSELRQNDEVGVLAFDDKYNWTVPITQASDLEDIKRSIETIGYGGGTSIYPALHEAYEQMLKSDAKLKHIILLTDGQDEFNQYGSLLNMINEAGITVSPVAVGSDSDRDTLAYIAAECGGRFYYTDINNSIPRIFAQEVYLSTNTYLINEEFYPSITSNNEILNGVMEGGCPALLGYVATTAKQTADVILESGKGDPVLTSWQYGLGRTVAWTSDGNNEWTAQYALWENYPMLWSNIINYVISDTELGTDNLEVQKEGNTATVTYETEDYDKNTKVSAVVTDEHGDSKEVVFDAVKPGVFATELNMDEIGVYSVNVRKLSGGDMVKSYNTAYANQYSAEYQFADTGGDFASFIRQAGGSEITLEDDVWFGNPNKIKTRISLTIPLLVTAILLFLFDIVIRRFSVDMLVYVKKGWDTGRRLFNPGKIGWRVPVKNNRKKNSADGEISIKDETDYRGQMSDAEKHPIPDRIDIGQRPDLRTPNRHNMDGTNIPDKESTLKPQNIMAELQQKKKENKNEKLDMNQLLKKKQERE